MEIQQCREIVEEVLRPLSWALFLNNWDLTVVYGTLDPTTMATCEPNEKYLRAKITIDPQKHESRSSVVDTIRHELLHCVLAEMDLFKASVKHWICAGSAEWAAVDEVYHHALERMVNQLESILGKAEATVRAGKVGCGRWNKAKGRKR